MTKSSRLTAIRALVSFGALVLAATSWAQTRPPIVEKLAKTYGLDSFGQIDAIRYTWSATFPGVNVSRTWTWEPKTGQVTYEGKDKEGKPVKVTYLRSQLNSQSDAVKNDIDPGFINDNYWLMLPVSRLLGHQRYRNRRRYAETAPGQGFRREDCGEVSLQRRLYAG